MELTRKLDSEDDQARKSSKDEPQSYYYRSVTKMEIRHDSKSQSYSLILVSGNSSLDLHLGGLFDTRENSSTQICVGNKNQTVLRELDSSSNLLGEASPRNALDVISDACGGSDFQLFPVAFFPQRREGRDNNYPTSLLIDFLIDNHNEENLHATEEKLRDGKSVKVFRVRRMFDSGAGASAWRLVISDEGFDKGLILQSYMGFLDNEHAKIPYVSDDRLATDQKESVVTTWKEYSTEEGKTLVLPKRILRRLDRKFSLDGKQIEAIEFDWKSFKAQENEDLSYEFAESRAKDLRRTVDRALNR